jgi:hypothetical protein
MQLTSCLFAGLAILSTVFALPSSLEKRSCSYFYLPQLNSLYQSDPTASNLSDTSPLYLWKDASGNRTDQLVSFRYLHLPAYGCELQLDYQPNPATIVDIEAGYPTSINVWRVSDGGNFPYSPTWDNTAPRMGPLIGTFGFPSGADLNTARVISIADFTCDSILTFRFSVALDSAVGGVSYPESATSGLRIAYNC